MPETAPAARLRLRGASAGLGGIGNDVDRRLAMDEASARIDLENFVHRRDGGAGELDLQFEAATAREWIEVGGVAAGPGEERDFVDRALEGDVVRLVANDTRGRGREAREAVDECRRPDVEVVRPAVMHQVPDDLRARLSRGAQHRARSSTSRSWPLARLDQVPAQAVAHRADPETCKLRVIAGRHWHRGRLPRAGRGDGRRGAYASSTRSRPEESF